MADCLVIGGNGFLGSHLVDALVERGHTVTVFDRFSTAPRWRVAGVGCIGGDFLNTADLEAAVHGRELVFHFLSTTTPASAERDPTIDLRTNVSQSIQLFDIASSARVRHLYYASSGGAIYGDQSSDRIAEDASAQPISPYAIGKQTIEGYLRYFRRVRGLESTSLRISNPYGPRQHDARQGVISIFLHRLAIGAPVDVLGDGSAVRDYVFADDAAAMIAELASAEPVHTVYNIGSGTGTSIDRLIETVRAVTGRSLDVRRSPQPPTFVNRVVLDTSRYVDEFGAPALVSLDEGIARTWRAELDGAG